MSAPPVQTIILESHFAALETISARRGWALEQVRDRDNVVRVTLKARDGETYHLQVECDGFPAVPPRFLWLDPATGALDEPSSMPAPGGYFHSSGRICAPWNRTASEAGGPHLDWASSDWRENPHTGAVLTISAMVTRIAHELQSQQYNGRRA